MVAAEKYKTLLQSHLMTWLWHIILLLRHYDILMHLKMSISIYDEFVSEPDIPTSVTLGLIYHFKCSSLFHHCTFRDYYPYQLFLKLLSILGFFFVCYLSMTIFTLALSSLGFEMCLMSLV